KVIWPEPIVPVHELDPAYVPVIVVPETDASPVALAVHDGCVSNPPAGIAIVRRIDDPETVPDTVPLAVRPVTVSAIVSVPGSDVPVCVSFRTIAPAPLASDARPLHVPLTSAAAPGVGAGDGCGVGPDDPPLPHAADTTVPRAI